MLGKAHYYNNLNNNLVSRSDYCNTFMLDSQNSETFIISNNLTNLINSSFTG